MIAYNSDWLDALLTRDLARKWHAKGWLGEEKWQAIQERYTSNFYSPNVFVRIGLAVFSLILLLAAVGLATLILEPESDGGFSIFSLFWATLCIVVLEIRVIGRGRHLGSGIDDMLLYSAVVAILTSFFIPLDYNTTTLLYCLIAWPVLVAGSVRYLDRILTLAAFVCSLMIIFNMVRSIPGLFIYLLPLSAMLFSAAAYFFARKGQEKFAWRHWHGQLTVVELLALIAFYASGNYWVVQQAASDFYQLEAPPLPWFFWAFTFAVPAAYLFWGLKRKDRHMLDIGLGCVGAAVFTFRYYFSVLPLAWAGVICGAALFSIAYFSIRYLHRHEGVYSYDEELDTSILQEIEQQLIEQTIANQPGPNPDKKDAFGGGQFGGGGAGNDF